MSFAFDPQWRDYLRIDTLVPAIQASGAVALAVVGKNFAALSKAVSTWQGHAIYALPSVVFDQLFRNYFPQDTALRNAGPAVGGLVGFYLSRSFNFGIKPQTALVLTGVIYGLGYLGRHAHPYADLHAFVNYVKNGLPKPRPSPSVPPRGPSEV